MLQIKHVVCPRLTRTQSRQQRIMCTHFFPLKDSWQCLVLYWRPLGAVSHQTSSKAELYRPSLGIKFFTDSLQTLQTLMTMGTYDKIKAFMDVTVYFLMDGTLHFLFYNWLHTFEISCSFLFALNSK